MVITNHLGTDYFFALFLYYSNIKQTISFTEKKVVITTEKNLFQLLINSILSLLNNV